MKAVLFFILFACFTVSAQTKLISHKSHSGNLATFGIAIESNLFDIGDSNFGDPPHKLVRKYTIDSIISLPGNKAVIVSSEKNIFEYLTYSGKEREKKDSISFIPKRDTVYNHPLFSKIHSLDSVRAVLRINSGSSTTPLDDVQFIGYDNKAEKYTEENKREIKKKEKKGMAPYITNDDTNFPSKPIIIFGLMVLSAVAMFLSYLLFSKKSALTA